MRGSRIPKYRRRRLPQGERAYVTLTDAATGVRHDFNLGPYGSPESRERYARLLAGWERAGRLLPELRHGAARADPGPTVAELCLAYWRAVEPRVSAGHAAYVKAILRLLRQLFGEIPATEFRPSMLRAVRAAFVTGDLEATPRRRPWSRRTANRGARQIVAMFNWGIGQELVPASVRAALAAIEPLRHGESAARESSPVGPVPHAVLDAVRPHLSGPIRAMVELQLVTGMRPGEVVSMRTRDLDMSGTTWVYRPARHKTQYRGFERVVHLGPRAQELVRPWLRTALEEPLFRPKHGGSRYSVMAYRQEVRRACDRADRQAKIAAGVLLTVCPECQRKYASPAFLERHICRVHPERELPPRDERLVPRWHPHQLRHNHATEVRRHFGAEAARAVLGHHSLDVTEIYAERDARVAAEVAAKLG